jgi:hypothetical protein
MINNSKVFNFFVNLLLAALIAACVIPFWLCLSARLRPKAT